MTSLPGAEVASGAHAGTGREVHVPGRLRRPVGPVAAGNGPTLTMRDNMNSEKCDRGSGKGTHIGLQAGTRRERTSPEGSNKRPRAYRGLRPSVRGRLPNITAASVLAGRTE